ncbi:MAG: alpha/beta hydrolase [Saccharofermentans sp.]|nr:alpha/beta hydrolase [Saccharofermentans sp.]
MKAKKRIMIAVLCILAVPLLLLAVWALLSPGKIRTYKEPESLSEKFVMDVNGAPNGFFINSRNIDNPVLLLVSSGPGTDDYVFTDKYKDMRLEDDFTLVYWDYRWMCIAYDDSVRKDEITLDNLLDDTQKVTEYLKERFNKEKIYIMGFSGGSHIALREAARHPENYYAYIGMAQCVTDSYENDTMMYDFMRKVFSERGDKKNLSKLEASVDHVENGNVKCKDWYSYVMLLHNAGGGTIRDKDEFKGITWPIITAKCYTLKEKINYVVSMKMYRTTPLASELDDFDYRQSLKELKVPAFFISGEYDYNCPWELVKEYNEKISAPSKGFYKITDAAHSPLWENPQETCRALREIKEKTQNG